jgi:hypothetical protein
MTHLLQISLNAAGSIRHTLFDEVELRTRQTCNVFITYVLTDKQLGQVCEISRSNSLRNRSNLFGCHLRNRHSENFELFVEGGAYMSAVGWIDYSFSVTDFYLDLSVRQQSTRDMHVVEVKTSDAVGRRRPLSVEADGIANAGLTDRLGDFISIELALGRIERVASTSWLNRRIP